jgi:hypothetical protein
MMRLFTLLVAVVAFGCDGGRSGGPDCDDDILEPGFNEAEQCTPAQIEAEKLFEGEKLVGENLAEIQANEEDFIEEGL